jgi:NADPH:quinone reductase-like Zn-dependent oxidoreductase
MAGVVEARGPACTLRLGVGSTVMSLLGSGGYSDYVVVDERLCIRVPDSVPLETVSGCMGFELPRV